MPDDASLAAQHARSASVEEIKVLVHDANEVTLLALLENPNVDEPDVVHLLERLDLTSKLLSAVADAGKWTSRCLPRNSDPARDIRSTAWARK